ncbi:PaaI family thioesterase [Saccharopolyspora sp. NPDC049357]|uniref:PaaI family thioesterase n=1 Tax=Saccharopolyspora sp. NPDC049357 TaxID=3154507 RepID=UPI003414531A
MTDERPGTTSPPAALPAPVLPEIPAETTLLAARIRELVEAGVFTDVAAEDLRAASEHVAAATELLRERTREKPLLLSYLDGHQVSVHNPVEGPGNPLAPPVVGLEIDDSGATSSSALLGAAYEGPPGRVHGGWVASLLDHAVGRAVAVAGHPAMTVSLTVDYRRGTPHGVPLTINARFTGKEGRKVFATGEIVADGETTAEASAILVTY